MKTKFLLLIFTLTSLLEVNAQQFSLQPVTKPNAELYCGFSAFSTISIPVGYNSEQQYDGTGQVTVYVFNPDFSVRKTFTVTPTVDGNKGTFWLDWLESANNLGSTFYASQHLFNDDDLFEFAIYGYYQDSEEVRHWKYYIYNENGELLGEIPNNKVYKFGDFVYFSDYESPSGFSLLSNNGSGSVNSIKVNPLRYSISPNPVSIGSNIIIEFMQPVEHDCIITFIDCNGAMLYNTRLPKSSNSISVPSNNLKPGVVIYSIQKGTTEIETGKLIVN